MRSPTHRTLSMPHLRTTVLDTTVYVPLTGGSGEAVVMLVSLHYGASHPYLVIAIAYRVKLLRIADQSVDRDCRAAHKHAGTLLCSSKFDTHR
jgi:hypothetical protein